MESEGGGFNLAAMQKDLLINVVPFLNGGNVHRLIAKILSRDPDGAPDFGYISEILEKAEPGSHGLFFLPYVTGERFPIMDSSVRGSFLGLSQETTAADMAQSVLEGVAFSIRQGLELFDHPALKITLIGGGARERRWCRILCNVMGQKIFVYKDPDLLPALAIASAVFVAEGVIPDYKSFIETLENQGHCDTVEPDLEVSEKYHGIYQKYKKNKHIAMLGISLDMDKQEWQDAIKRDTLNWEQVCDFGGLNSEVAKQYAIKQVPSNILLSADGKILAKNLKGEQLKKKIEEVVTAAEEKEKQDNKKKK